MKLCTEKEFCVFTFTIVLWMTVRIFVLRFIRELLQREAGFLPSSSPPPPLVRATGARKVRE